MARKKIHKDVLSWRRRQPHGAIMRRSTFEKIKRKAARRGATDPQAVAGAAYWKTVRAKYRGKKQRKLKRSRSTK
ncbi:MAG: hypothetical protein AB1478_12325 [Nitrospirota bacterium]